MTMNYTKSNFLREKPFFQTYAPCHTSSSALYGFSRRQFGPFCSCTFLQNDYTTDNTKNALLYSLPANPGKKLHAKIYMYMNKIYSVLPRQDRYICYYDA